MSAGFDPYYRWLGIPPAEQPPDHYRLLALTRFENNAEVIAAAAERQSAYVRNFQTSSHAEFSQKLLNRIAAAKVCLLNTHRKAIYDSHLRTMLSAEGIAGPAVLEAELADDYDGSVFGEYLLLDRIGSARSGQVFKAAHRSMGRLVALKVLSREAMSSPEQIERFYRKVKILARLTHPNLVAAYDAGEREGTHYLIMEYVDGQDLVAWMKQFGPLPVDMGVNYVAQAAAGLGYAHTHGVYHRNVKPGNLLLDKEGVVRVIGFGLARIDPRSPLAAVDVPIDTESGQVLGTLDYMAPEQAADSNVADGRSDVYSLGCTLYAVLTGRLPYPVKSPADKIAAHREQAVPSLCAVRREVPPALDAVFRQMLAKRPEDRYPTAEEAAAALSASIT